MRVLADARRIPLVDGCVQCCVTSPPYWGLRDYGVSGQLGLEATPDAYVAAMVEVFREVWRVLRDDGTVWLNLGDCYATGAGAVGEHPGGGAQGARWRGDATRHRDDLRRDNGRPYVNGRGETQSVPTKNTVGPMTQPNRMPIEGLKAKDLVGIPWRVAFALQADGWYLRSDVIWSKPNPMPESVTDRPTKAHEYVFLLTKSERYLYDAAAIREPYAESTRDEIARGYEGDGQKDYEAAGVQNPSDVKRRIIAGAQKNLASGDRRRVGVNKWDKRDRKGVQSSGPLPLHSIGKREGRHEPTYDPSGRNARSVWTITTQPYTGAHFATMPQKLAERCILAGSRPGDLVLDPFGGSGTTVRVARSLNRRGVMTELNPSYHALAKERISEVQVSLLEGTA